MFIGGERVDIDEASVKSIAAHTMVVNWVLQRKYIFEQSCHILSHLVTNIFLNNVVTYQVGAF